MAVNDNGDGGPQDQTEVETPVVVAIHVAPATRLPMQARDEVMAEAGKGLVGDRYHGTRHRHVTVQAADALDQATEVLGAPVLAEATRRNITISGGEVPTEIGRRITIAGVELEVVRIAAPCKLLDDVIGDGARTALRRRAGTVFRLLSSGPIAIGDVVDLDPVSVDGAGQPDRGAEDR